MNPAPKPLLVGTGKMGKAYAKVLKSLNVNFNVVGRGKSSRESFAASTHVLPFNGNLHTYLEQNESPNVAIVAVDIERLVEVCIQLIKAGCKKILLEKPGSLERLKLIHLSRHSDLHDSSIYLAYNRRFYSSVLEFEKLIMKDGKINSGHFDFTERSSRIKTLDKSEKVKSRWLIANSTHVIDLFFFIAGLPQRESFVCRQSSPLDWHPSGSIFNGSGISLQDIPFSYLSDWRGPGGWSMCFTTDHHKYTFKPLEELYRQKHNSNELEKVETKHHHDIEFKPGLYLQTKTFLEDIVSTRLCTIEEQIHRMSIYNKIAGYRSDIESK